VAVDGQHGARDRAADRGARFTAVMTAIVGRLPFGLAGLISPRLAGFLAISAVTFTVDLTVLTAVHGGLGWPLPASITVAYTAASALGYLLNRVLNFRSHGAVGPQVIWYAAVIVVNYLVCILGVTDALAALSVDYRLARVAAAVCEAVYMYTALRWVVFRDVTRHPAPAPSSPDSEDPGLPASRNRT
jgi:putative flippase GtrA